MSQIALIKNGIVENVIVADIAVDEMPDGFTTIDTSSLSQQPCIGWTYANGAFTAPPAPTPTPIPLPQQAQSALTKTDTTMLRVQEAIMLGLTTATTADVVAFVHYRKALRAIVGGTDTTSTSLPAQPAYPANT